MPYLDPAAGMLRQGRQASPVALLPDDPAARAVAAKLNELITALTAAGILPAAGSGTSKPLPRNKARTAKDKSSRAR